MCIRDSQVAGAFTDKYPYPPTPLILPAILRSLVIFRMKSGALSAQELVPWGPEDFGQIKRLIDLLEHFNVNEFGDLENLFKEYM